MIMPLIHSLNLFIRAKFLISSSSPFNMDETEYLCDRIAIIDSGKIVALDTPDYLIDHLVASGFEKPKEVKKANLEDVFIHLTGKSLRKA